jgi:hypothetical protein
MIAAVGLLTCATPARADATVFFGGLASGGFQSVAGISVGMFPRDGGSWLGFDLESTETRGKGGRDIETYGGNFLVQWPVVARRLQYYAALGFGIYTETTDDGRGSGLVATKNGGGGLKITLVGPLKIRLDYRLFFLGDAGDSALGDINPHPQRFTAGVVVAF